MTDLNTEVKTKFTTGQTLVGENDSLTTITIKWKQALHWKLKQQPINRLMRFVFALVWLPSKVNPYNVHNLHLHCLCRINIDDEIINMKRELCHPK